MLNKVKLLGHYGGDLTHAMSAWASTNAKLTPEKEKRIGVFLKNLAEAGHHTPFEKSYLHFFVTCDIASHIHLLKHRHTSINAESARYKELKEDKYHIPKDWPKDVIDDFESLMSICYNTYHSFINKLVIRGFDRKRAKESARYVLPYANQLNMDIGFNFRSFMHFQGLRNKPDAQLEIREIAQQMLSSVKETGDFKYSLEGFGYV